MMLRLSDACVPTNWPTGATVDKVGWLVCMTKKLLRFVFGTKVRTYGSLLQSNTEFVALVCNPPLPPSPPLSCRTEGRTAEVK
jgi:hypothetical protein